MTKSRKFSIYLLKPDQDDHNSLKENYAPSSANNLPPSATLYIFDKPAIPPWWRNFLGVVDPLMQEHKAAILFMPAGGRTFALTFGHAYHNLKDDAYEYDFGLLVTLNCIDHDKLKSADTVEPGAAKRRRTQIPVANTLTYLDFDRDTTVVKSLTGKVKQDYAAFFKEASGASSLHVSMKVEPSELPAICVRLLERYSSSDYKAAFPDIDNIKPVKDPRIIAQLDPVLLTAFRAKNPDLYLAPPAILDYSQPTWFAYSDETDAMQYEGVDIADLYGHLTASGTDPALTDVSFLKTQKLYQRQGDQGIVVDDPSIYRCLVFDTKLPSDGNSTYHLCDGLWYKVRDSFISSMDSYLDENKFKTTASFIDFNHKDNKGNWSEGAYNAALAEHEPSLTNLDRKDISPQGEHQIEPCDIYAYENGKCRFFHIKRSTLSSKLSHLFSQGANSMLALLGEKESMTKFKGLIGNRYGADHDTAIAARENYEVNFVMITHKDTSKRSENLPLFSRINLKRVLKELELMHVKAGYFYVKDISESEPDAPQPQESVSLETAQ